MLVRGSTTKDPSIRRTTNRGGRLPDLPTIPVQKDFPERKVQAMRKVIGISLLSTPFVLIAGGVIYMQGIKGLLIVIGVFCGIVVPVFMGLRILYHDK